MTKDHRPSLPTELEYLVGVAQRQLSAGQFAAAEATYRQILTLRPDYAAAYSDLGNVLFGQGRFDQAVVQYERAVALEPTLYQAHNNLGNVFSRQLKFDQAIARYKQALSLKPDFVEAYSNLAGALRACGQFEEAVRCYQQAIALAPNNAQAHNNLGSLFGVLGQFDAARKCFTQALTLQPDYVEACNNLGNIFAKQGKFEQAVPWYQQALSLKSDDAVAHHNLGMALKGLGQFDAARLQFEAALALRPDFAEAHFQRADLKTFLPGDADLAALERLAAEPALLPAAKMLHVHFALGKALDDVGDYRRAFDQWLQGGALKRREVDYDERASEQLLRRIIKTFNPTLFDRLATSGDPAAAPIFILGMPRSGSTLIEQILASHPAVHGAGELPALNLVAHSVPGSAGRPIPFPACVSRLDATGLKRLGQAYLAALPALPDGKSRITDKETGNFWFVGLIHLMLPNARIIHTRRNPVDTCISCFSKLFAAGQIFSYDLAELGRAYRRYSELMEHWRAVLPAGVMLEVTYEDVVDNLPREARRMLEFCGLTWDEHCLSFYETRRSIATASNVQVRRPLYRSSIERWRHYEAHLGPLLDELNAQRPSA
jgi:tetratricopeptide (TPR) repeat protein